MKAITTVLMLASLILLSSCSCNPKTEYVDRIVYVEPVLPEVTNTKLPSIELNVWGDYAIYKAQCEAKIKSCNSEKNSIINSVKQKTERVRDE